MGTCSVLGCLFMFVDMLRNYLGGDIVFIFIVFFVGNIISEAKLRFLIWIKSRGGS